MQELFDPPTLQLDRRPRENRTQDTFAGLGRRIGMVPGLPQIGAEGEEARPVIRHQLGYRTRRRGRQPTLEPAH